MVLAPGRWHDIPVSEPVLGFASGGRNLCGAATPIIFEEDLAEVADCIIELTAARKSNSKRTASRSYVVTYAPRPQACRDDLQSDRRASGRTFMR